MCLLKYLAHSCIESLLAAVSLHVVDDGPVEGRGPADPPGADQYHAHPDLLQGLHHLLVKHDCQVDAIDLKQVTLNKCKKITFKTLLLRHYQFDC